MICFSSVYNLLLILKMVVTIRGLFLNKLPHTIIITWKGCLFCQRWIQSWRKMQIKMLLAAYWRRTNSLISLTDTSLVSLAVNNKTKESIQMVDTLLLVVSKCFPVFNWFFYFTSISFLAFCFSASLSLGNEMLNTPLFTWAAILSLSTSSGNIMVCWNLEYENSRRR